MNGIVGIVQQQTANGARWFRCDSAVAAEELARSPSPASLNQWRGVDNDSGRGANWYGVFTHSQAEAIIRSGQWEEGVARLRAALDGLGESLPPRSIKRQRVRRDFGSEVDIHQYWAGRADIAWSDCRRLSKVGPKAVTIIVKVGGLAGVRAESMFWRGAAALKLADVLTTSGYNVELEASHTSRNVGHNGEGFAVTIPVKAATAPLDLNSLAVTCCLGGYFRIAIFKMMCAMPGGQISPGFGGTVGYRSLITETDDPRDVILCDGDIDTQQEARDWVKQQIEKLNQEAA